MTFEEIQKAYEAKQSLVRHRAELKRLKDIEPRPNKMRAYWKLQVWEQLFEQQNRLIRDCEDKIRECEQIIDGVLSWAAAGPDDINQIVRLRVLEQLEWPEVSSKASDSNAPAWAYNRLSRYIDGTGTDDRP